MSLKTLLNHIWEAIGSIFHHAEAEVKGVFLPAVTSIVTVLKTAVDIDQVDFLGNLYGAAGAALENKLREKLPAILTELKLVQSGNIEEAIAALKLSTNRAQDAFYHSIAAMLLVDFTDGKLSWSEAVELVEFYYKNKPA